ncbi:MAG: ABC transporter ATP-binding protein [Nitrososphaerota archaeon]|nr:ABC transporter ATP-binding protein [Candidatus Bathyarchaeota archaeon]MDW8022839.1 ABC transporter ATP-binding protein [Nitrososphaerota archaeon]
MSINPPVTVAVRNVSKRYGSLEVLTNINFQVDSGEFFVVVGPSGCGKTTLLKIISGLENPSSGSVVINGKTPDFRAQRVGFVFQEDFLFPWRTVEENVRFGLEIGGLSKEDRVKEMVSLVGLRGFEHFHPHQISGGMRKRVAIARALAVDPSLLLMDEPFGDLDAQTRWIMHKELWAIHEKLKKTTIFVTHNVEEAVYLGDRVLVLTKRPGTVKKIIPIELQRPRDKLSREFINYREMIIQLLREEVPEI